MTLPEVGRHLAERAEELCRELLAGGKMVGRKWICGDVSGAAGDSMEVELVGDRAGLWFDHATGEGGDLLELIRRQRSVSIGAAADWARERFGWPKDGTVVSDAFDPLRLAWRDKESGEDRYGSKSWAYHDPAGNIIAYVVRFDTPTGKDIIPLRYIDGKWKWKGWAKPAKNPLFNQHKLAARPGDAVLVVEGEKTAQAAEKLFPELVVTTAQGGAKKFPFADWSPIDGRDLILWPDADRSGRSAMEYLKARFPKARMVDTSGLPDKWDLADPVPDGVSLRGLLDGSASQPAQVIVDERIPYRPLGHDEDGFHYLSFRTGRVETIRDIEHTELRLQCLAPDSHWTQRGYYQERGTGVDWKAVAKLLMEQQFAQGTYDPDMIRGRGCWLEGTTIVYHAGNALIVDGQRKGLEEHKTRWIYPARPAISIDVSNPLTAQEIEPFVELCDLLPWRSPGTGWMLSSICFLAPVCGALDWRPSAWLKGVSGSGKSWTQANVISRTIGPCVNALSTTSAAGIRQALGLDALPVLFDECEAKDPTSVQRIAGVLELLRQASSETGGSIYKGTPSGTANKYKTRSIFIFSSIASAAVESADESRIAQLEYRKRQDEGGRQDFARVKKIAETTVSQPDWCLRLNAAAILKAPLIRDSAMVFLQAITEVCGDARKGQQYGTLAAGRWAMLHSAVPTMEEAKTWASTMDWENLGAGSQTDSDQSRATDVLLQARCELIDNDGRPHRLSVGEALDIYFRNDDREGFALDALMRMGIHPMRSTQTVDIADRHSDLARIFERTQFCGKWREYFSRLDGAVASFFRPRGSKVLRAIRIPRNVIMGTDEN